MSDTLLTTKLYAPPSRPNSVPRPRLVQKLDEGLMMGRRLTLVSAPAGYGKTTLVSTWLRSTDHRFTWLSLDSGDDDLACFFAYLVAALQRVDVGIELTVQDLLDKTTTPPG